MTLAELDCDPRQLGDEPAHPIPQGSIGCDPAAFQEESIRCHPACLTPSTMETTLKRELGCAT